MRPPARLGTLLLTMCAGIPLALGGAGAASAASAPTGGTVSVDAPQPDTGVVTGRVMAVDPDGDPLTFAAPPLTGKGSVALAPDGTFVFTPTPEARAAAVVDPIDFFTVTVSDPFGGVLDVPVNVAITPLGPPAPPPPAAQPVGPGVSFNFLYGPGAELWTPEARGALEAGAAALASYLVVPQPVVIDVGLVGVNTPGSPNIASAWVGFTDNGPGFTGTWLQTKLQNGIDPSGPGPEVELTVNFAENWNFSEAVAPDRYDFRTVVLHEMVHALGFLSGADDVLGQDSNWTLYDSFLRAPDGSPVIDEALQIKPQYLANFTGANGGLFFAGPNAMAAFGGPVPLFTPDPWVSASRSVSHVNGLPGFLMTPFYGYGSAIRSLSPVEQAMLRDLGYVVNPPF
ncbi:MAG: hypothetical protein KDB50_08350 [Mycobacterium sp.]|nr:hypothetical protein [Mycobacterium sp.]